MKTILLIGGGHAHLHCLRQYSKERASAYRVMLISPSAFQYYSGMFSGFTEGLYDEEEIRADLRKLCEEAGAEFIQDTVVSMAPDSRQVFTSDGRPFTYDAVSFDIGSQIGVPAEFEPYVLNIKPNFHFTDSIRAFRASPYPVIVGGGASGVELALSILSWRKKQQLEGNVTLISSSPLLASYGKAASAKMDTIASQKGLTYHINETVEQIDEQTVVTNSGRTVPHSLVLWLTGPAAPLLFRQTNITHDSSGFLAVNDYLQSVHHPSVFGAGDCVTMQAFPSLPKNGVYAVRQGPVLWENIQKFLSGVPLRPFQPQKRFLSILSTGRREGLLSYGGLAVHGHLPWKMKHFIDERFMKPYK
jgi:pyridine nucleotide-disulfide oxidoreductase family protein